MQCSTADLAGGFFLFFSKNTCLSSFAGLFEDSMRPAVNEET